MPLKIRNFAFFFFFNLCPTVAFNVCSSYSERRLSIWKCSEVPFKLPLFLLQKFASHHRADYGVLPLRNLEGKTLCSENAAVFGILGLVLKINLIEKICFLF